MSDLNAPITGNASSEAKEYLQDLPALMRQSDENGKTYGYASDILSRLRVTDVSFIPNAELNGPDSSQMTFSLTVDQRVIAASDS